MRLTPQEKLDFSSFFDSELSTILTFFNVEKLFWNFSKNRFSKDLICRAERFFIRGKNCNIHIFAD